MAYWQRTMEGATKQAGLTAPATTSSIDHSSAQGPLVRVQYVHTRKARQGSLVAAVVANMFGAPPAAQSLKCITAAAAAAADAWVPWFCCLCTLLEPQYIQYSNKTLLDYQYT